MKYDKIEFYGGFFLLGLGIVSMCLLLMNLETLELPKDFVLQFSFMFTVGTGILFYMGLFFIHKSINIELQNH